MLLSAKRSCLLMPASDDGADERPGAERAAANRKLLRTAAERLKVPVLGQRGFTAKDAASQERPQLVLAAPVDSQAIGALPDALQVFVVIDALAEEHRPSPAELAETGATAVTTEMVVFEWLERADTDDFRALLALIR